MSALRIFVLVVCLVPLATLGAVVTASYKPSEPPLDATKSFAVLTSADERGQLGLLICGEMARRGIDVELIYAEKDKQTTQMLVRYEAVWNLISVSWRPIAIGISVFDGDTGYLLAGEVTYRDALAIQRTEKTVAELVDRLFDYPGDQSDSNPADCKKRASQ